MASIKAAWLLAWTPRRKVLTLLHIFSIGLRSGRVSRQEKHPGSSPSYQVEGFLVFVRPKVVHDHHSPGRNAGPRTCRTYVWKTSVSVAPSMVMQAVEPSSRMELIMVVVCQ